MASKQIPEGKTIALDGGALVRICPECAEQVELEQVVSDVYEVTDRKGNQDTVFVAQGAAAPKGHHVEPRGEHTDYDDAAYVAHYRKEH